MLTPKELERYDRQIMIDEIGEAGQEKLKNAKVFIAGAGGLGSSISTYLTVAGVGTIKIVDHDSAELSNLNRQVLHWNNDIGRKKVESAEQKLQNMNPDIDIQGIEETITEKNISELALGSDLIIDAMDNFPTRDLLNKYAVDNNIPFFHGAVKDFEGRAMTVIPGKSACFRCLYKGPVPEEKFPVIGVLPGLIGCIQATEVIKYITGIGELLSNKLLIYDGLEMKFTILKVNRNPDCEHCGKLYIKEGTQ